MNVLQISSPVLRRSGLTVTSLAPDRAQLPSHNLILDSHLFLVQPLRTPLLSIAIPITLGSLSGIPSWRNAKGPWYSVRLTSLLSRTKGLTTP